MLRDIQAYCIGKYVGELRKIMRNDGGIVTVCAQIRDKKPFNLKITTDPGSDAKPNLKMVPVVKDEQAVSMLRNFIEKVLAGDVLRDDGNPVHPLQDVQVIVANNKDTPVARDSLNKLMQSMFNKNPVGDHKYYKEGDKIICLDNCQIDGMKYDADQEKWVGTNKKYRVSNGELGVVVASYEKRLIAKMDGTSESMLCIPCGSGKAEGSWDLGYAVTCHKFQGSETQWVLIFFGDSFRASRVTCRAWLYTAISRAKYCSLVFGTQGLLNKVVKRDRTWVRKSVFDHWFAEELRETETHDDIW